MIIDDVVFVILNYNLFNEVVNCINSIKNKCDTEKYHIIIIDNCSPNKSGQKLSDYYVEDEKVIVKVLNNNLGFAKGNNVGIDLARKTFLPKYICCLNNDTLFIDDCFFQKLEECYNKTNASIIAPKVYLKDGNIQPIIGYLRPISYYERALLYMEGNGYQGLIYKIKQRLKEFYIIRAFYQIIKNKSRNNFNPYIEYKNIILHGCCLIFTPIFFEKLNGFNYKTFMFREEELLFLSLKINNLENVYYPKLEIKHLEDVSTDVTYKTNKEKEKFLRENQIKSLKILISELKFYENTKSLV